MIGEPDQIFERTYDANRAFGHNRTVALSLIVPQMLGVAHAVGVKVATKGQVQTRAKSHGFSIFLCENPDGTYFRIDRGHDLLMTGYLDPTTGLGKYLDGRIHIKTWRRGPSPKGDWQREFIRNTDIPPKPLPSVTVKKASLSDQKHKSLIISDGAHNHAAVMKFLLKMLPAHG